MRYAFAAAFALIAAVPAAAAAPGWAGRYSFENDLGRNAGGFYMTVEHRLTLGPRGCRLDAEGYQTDTHILCRAAPAGAAVAITFVSYADGKLANQYGTILYRPGQTLFTLTQTRRGLITRWGAYKPDATRAMGPYFRQGR